MKSEVFNNSIGSPYSFDYPRLTKEQDQQILAGLFEQLLVFDKITITTNRLNFALVFLLSRLGINTVERLLDNGYINLMIWSPVIVAGSGRKLDDGRNDESAIYGKPPISAGSLTDNDLDPEKNIHNALLNFDFHKDRKKILTRRALNHYIIPDGMEFSTGATNLIIDAYQNNDLNGLGLPFEKEPDQLDLAQRMLLLDLGHKVLETAILSKYNLKSYENFEHFEICKQNFSNIGKAFRISANTTEILKIENLPNLRALFLEEKLNFDTVFKTRYLSTSKYFRKWINEVGENANSYEVTAEYMNQIKGNSKYFESTQGKFLKNLGLFGLTSGLGAVISGAVGASAGAIIGKAIEPAVDYGLGLLETFWLDNVLRGGNPSMFINEIKKEISNQQD